MVVGGRWFTFCAECRRCGSGRCCGIGLVFRKDFVAMKLNRTFIFVGLAALGVVLGCRDNKTTVGSAPVTGTTAQKPADSDPELQISGPIVVENQVDLAAQRDGVVARIIADTGTMVHKGQLLAEMDDRQLSAERDAADAKAKSIAADVKNWEAEAKVQETDLAPRPRRKQKFRRRTWLAPKA